MSLFNGFLRWIYDFGNWLYKVMYLHILWVAFTLLGLIVFGVSPATTALYTVMHKWYEKDFDIPIFKNFYAVYKQHFKTSNAFGILFMSIGAFMYIDIAISKNYIQSFYFHALLLFIGSLYVIMLLYFYPVFVRYNLKFHQYIKQSFLIALARPLETIAMIISIILLLYVFYFLPILLVFAGSSIIATPIMWFAHQACLQIENKQMS
ncbi:MAG: YesL family protein [Bacillota bacterium]|uniref:DUF624 domain-containing protein n=1 Tax=Virgibacillus salarius TaxID=447199 RepID=A0A941DUU7_9BACI|nr:MULTISPECIES: DUF624 domain-containing protein [Bacillaceae]NAZ08490.1 DUF624 domain-containing protein [Agaribacter marinus]MBR7795777.1 DUF624 domain-containing protein [Virgibacillus salarius]MCC2248663.1 DUF624 domain-containing protein [Virgibacillus sp. AGTR]QRZ18419.1 DUF624 domain-containing protein [Virgibacillus sp. AGTR]WBX81958.1 DUF624 domain-containing protein [Virgibacillus salarius]